MKIFCCCLKKRKSRLNYNIETSKMTINKGLTHEADKITENFKKFKNSNTFHEKKPQDSEFSINNLSLKRNKISVCEKSQDSKNFPLYEYKDKFMCMFCGGSECKHENWKYHPNPIIKGLHSDQINDDIYASQRPSNRLIHKYNLVQKFQELNIGLIVNVQLQGEHPYCGDKLDPNTGFSYDPQIFISENISCKNYGWKDMSVPDSIYFMLKIVKNMITKIKIENKKVLVHCHAGYGRTGCVIACYLIYENHTSLDEIVRRIRSKRPGCIQKESQLKFCQRFKDYIDRARTIFTSVRYPIDTFIKHQNDIIYEEEFNEFEFVPLILKKVLKKSIALKKINQIDNDEFFKSFYLLNCWDDKKEVRLIEIKKSINVDNWNEFDKLEDTNLLSVLLYDWLDDCVVCVIPPEKIIKFFNKTAQDYDFLKVNEDRFSLENNRSLIKYIKESFRRIEIQILICIILFLDEITPSENIESIHFERMKERLILGLTGINVDTVGFIQHHKKEVRKANFPSEIELLISKFKDLIRILIRLYESDNNNFVNLLFDKQDSVMNSLNFNSFNDMNKSKKKIKVTPLDKNEREMFKLYENLENYFFNKSKGINHKISELDFSGNFKKTLEEKKILGNHNTSTIFKSSKHLSSKFIPEKNSFTLSNNIENVNKIIVQKKYSSDKFKNSKNEMNKSDNVILVKSIENDNTPKFTSKVKKESSIKLKDKSSPLKINDSLKLNRVLSLEMKNSEKNTEIKEINFELFQVHRSKKQHNTLLTKQRIILNNNLIYK